MSCSSSFTCPRNRARSAFRLSCSILKRADSVRGNSPASASLPVVSTTESSELTMRSASSRRSRFADHDSQVLRRSRRISHSSSATPASSERRSAFARDFSTCKRPEIGIVRERADPRTHGLGTPSVTLRTSMLSSGSSQRPAKSAVAFATPALRRATRRSGLKTRATTSPSAKVRPLPGLKGTERGADVSRRRAKSRTCSPDGLR